MRPLPTLLLPLVLLTSCFTSKLDPAPGDPAPGVDTPGEYGCEGCPDLEIDTFERTVGDVTFEPLSGTLTNPGGDGVFYVAGPGNREFAGTIQVDENGSFDFIAPLFCGEQLVKCVFENATGRYVLVQRLITTDCVEPDVRVTLAWDEKGGDFELHLLRPGGTINDNASDCTWTSCVSQSPDWGVAGDESDNPKKDVDDTGTYGPENVFLAKPVDGTYAVYVEHWGAGADDAKGSAHWEATYTFAATKRKTTASAATCSRRPTAAWGATHWRGACGVPRRTAPSHETKTRNRP